MKKMICVLFIFMSPCYVFSSTKSSERDALRPIRIGSSVGSELDPENNSSRSPASAKNSTEKKKQITGRGVSHSQALTWLKNGNRRFRNQNFRADGRTPNDRIRLLNAQAPHAYIFTTADSRVVPEIIFDQVLGEIKVSRSSPLAWHDRMPETVIEAVLEYGVKLFVIMGHTHQKSLQKARAFPEKKEEMTELAKEVYAQIYDRLETVHAREQSPNMQIEAALNADGIAQQLRKGNPQIQKWLNSGEIEIITALYDMSTGQVAFFESTD